MSGPGRAGVRARTVGYHASGSYEIAGQVQGTHIDSANKLILTQLSLVKMGVVQREIVCFSYALCRYKSSAAHGLLEFLFPPVNEWMLILLAPSDTWLWLSNTVLPPSDWNHWELKLPFPSPADECGTPDSSPADNPRACCSHQSHSNCTAGAAVRLPCLPHAT